MKSASIGLPPTGPPDEKTITSVQYLLGQLRTIVLKEQDNDGPSSKETLTRMQSLLTQLKIALMQFQLTPPFTGPEALTKQQLRMARDTLELGALAALRARDVESFERQITQLKLYWTDLATFLPDSDQRLPLLGTYLLGLLANNKIADFHTELELLPLPLQNNQYIKYPIQLEQHLMEGAYNKILDAKQHMPLRLFAFFLDILVITVRDKMSECAEKAYDSFPVEDACRMLMFKTSQQLEEYAKKRHWEVRADRTVVFPSRSLPRERVLDIGAHPLIRQHLSYAVELERIV